MKEKIQVLREKFSLLHNQLDYQMDILGPWMEKNIWIYQDPKLKLSEWAKLFSSLNEEYDSIIETKKELVTEFEIIMDTKSRNYYHIKNRELNYSNRKKIVPDCVKLTPNNLSQLNWMPNTCAYKLVNEGKKLPSWHPLMQEEYDKKTHEKYSVAKKVISEDEINMENITDYIYDWDKEVKE